MAGRCIRAAVAALAVTAFLSGCATTAGGTGEKNVRTLEGTYAAPQSAALPNDIRKILAAGGLDSSDPSAPTGTTEVAEIATNASRDLAKGTQLASNLEESTPSLLSMAGSTPSAPSKPLTPTPVTVTAAPAPQTVTFVYPEIGQAAAEEVKVTVAEVQQKPSRRAAQVRTESSLPADTPAEPKRPRRF